MFESCHDNSKAMASIQTDLSAAYTKITFYGKINR